MRYKYRCPVCGNSVTWDVLLEEPICDECGNFADVEEKGLDVMVVKKKKHKRKEKVKP